MSITVDSPDMDSQLDLPVLPSFFIFNANAVAPCIDWKIKQQIIISP